MADAFHSHFKVMVLHWLANKHASFSAGLIFDQVDENNDILCDIPDIPFHR